VHAAGINTALLAPAVLLRYVPIVSNARMPGRAIVMTYLAIAMLAAIGLASARLRRGRVVMAVLGVLAAADFLAAPFPTLRIDPPAIYQTVRDRPERGALAELPVGLADGFGRLTPLDPAMLVNQSVHGRPVVGGFVARLLPETLRAYRQDPLLAAWLRLSGMRGLEQAPLPDRDQARAMLRRDGIALVMLHRRQASADLRRYVESTLPLSLVADDGERVLYTVR
jgi:hypothetical protein